jgi:hypothetical protein
MSVQRSAFCLLSFVVLLAAGCGSTKTAPVSGRITLNGKPLAKASVTFAPIGSKDKQEPGPSSAGITDADGRYSLTLIGEEGNGAMIGKHKVRIALQEEVDTTVDEIKPKDAAKLKQLPLKYNGQTTLEFDVPAGGTDKADFELKVP